MKKTGDLLEVGDVLYQNSRWYGSVRYEVTRATPKQVVFNDGSKAKREISTWYTGELAVQEIGEYGKFNLETPELKAEYELQQHQNKIANWFSSKEFSFEDKEAVYNLFNATKSI